MSGEMVLVNKEALEAVFKLLEAVGEGSFDEELNLAIETLKEDTYHPRYCVDYWEA